MRALTRSWDDLELIKRRDGLLLVHHSIGTDTVPKVLASPARKAIVYHNITPGRYFAGLNDYLKTFAELGREQLKELAKAAEFGIADSEYNRKELEAAGVATTAARPRSCPSRSTKASAYPFSRRCGAICRSSRTRRQRYPRHSATAESSSKRKRRTPSRRSSTGSYMIRRSARTSSRRAVAASRPSPADTSPSYSSSRSPRAGGTYRMPGRSTWSCYPATSAAGSTTT